MFPEGLTVTSAEDMEFRPVIDSGESVIVSVVIWALSGRCSVGVGGVTVVAGVGMGIAVCGGVFGNGLACKERGLSCLSSLLSIFHTSVRMGLGTGGGVSWEA